MNNDQKQVLGEAAQRKLSTATPSELAEFILKTKAQQYTAASQWIEEMKAESQATYNNAQTTVDQAVTTAQTTKAEAQAKIALYDSILALV